MEIIGGVILLALLGVGILAFMLANGPVELGIFRDDVERALAQSRDGRPVDLEKVYLEWSPSQKKVTVTADGVVFRDADGNIGASAKRAEIVLDASSLIVGKIEPLRLHLQSGELLAEEAAEGWSVAGEAPIPIVLPEGKFPENPAEILEAANNGLQASLSTLRAGNQNLTLESLSFEDFTIVARNKADAEVFNLKEAAGSLSREVNNVSLSLSAAGGSGLPETLSIGLSAPADFTDIKGDIGLTGWSLEALTEQFNLPDDLLSGDLSGLTFSAVATAGGGLQQAGLNLQPSKISVRTESQFLEFEELGFDAKYELESDEVSLDVRSLKHERISGPVSLKISDAMKGSGGARDFELTSPGVTIDATPMFSRAWPLSDIDIIGRVDFTEKGFAAEQIVFNAEGLKFHASGAVALKEKRQETDLPFILEGTARLKGPVGPDLILDYWPVKLGKGARVFIRERVEKATLMDVDAAINIRQDSFLQGFLADEALSASFSITDATIRFLDDVPAVSVPAATGRLTGNSFMAEASEGILGTVALTDGVYELPRMNPKGGDFRVYAKGKGEVRDIVRIVSDSRLQIQARTGFDPDTLSGITEGEIELFRPALKTVAPGAMRFTAKGKVENAGLQNAAYGIDLTDASTRVEVNEKSMTIAGFGQWGAMPVQFTWRDGFDDRDTTTSLSASAIIDPDVLNRFGFLGRTYLTGEAPVEIQAQTDGKNLIQANVSVDLQEARVDIAELGWSKKPGEPGRARITYKPGEGAPVTTAFMESDDLLIDGDFVLDPDNKLISANLRRAFIDEFADVKGSIKRGNTGELIIDLNGAFLDISDALDGFGGSEGIFGDVALDADVEKLRLRDEIVLADAELTLRNNKQGLQRFGAEGVLSDKSKLKIDYDGRSSSEPKLSISSGNAGFLTAAILGDDFLSGGNMTISGTLAAGDLPTKLDVKIRDARMRNAPFLTQILSLASLRGLADTLSGEGVLFSSIDIPLTISGGRYTINGARAQGPALGLTANGWLRIDGQALRVDGVLVPSFGINSALGGVPILGDLFVSRDGEGVFSLTYGVRGSLTEANVSVNPLSAITPGVLRRVFENPGAEPLPKGDPTKPPPPPVAPLPPPEEF